MSLVTASDPFVIWLSGPSGVGKTTLAIELCDKIGAIIIDGDDLRKDSRHLPQGEHPFGLQARTANVKHAVSLTRNAMLKGKNVIVAMISPDRIPRELAMAMLSFRVLMVCMKCDFETLRQRDTKDIYRRAAQGDLKNVCGVDFDYEPPTASENPLTIDTEILCTACATRSILRTLRNRKWLEEKGEHEVRDSRPTPAP